MAPIRRRCFQCIGLYRGTAIAVPYIVSSGFDGQLSGKQKIAAVAFGNFDHLTLLALAADVLL